MIRPVDSKVVVVLNEINTASQFGILLPETIQKKRQDGVVVAVGPGKFAGKKGVRVPTEVKVGDKVLTPKYGGDTVTENGVDYLILDECQILAVLN